MPTQPSLPVSIVADLEAAGYYPELATHLFAETLFGETVVDHLVHVDTHFDLEAVHRHITMLMLTETRLLLGHIDDENVAGSTVQARATTSELELDRLGTVMLSQSFLDPEQFAPGQEPTEVILTISWGDTQRFDAYPADCADPECDADHGSSGTLVTEDLTLRVATGAEGQPAVNRARDFGNTLRRCVFRARRSR